MPGSFPLPEASYTMCCLEPSLCYNSCTCGNHLGVLLKGMCSWNHLYQVHVCFSRAPEWYGVTYLDAFEARNHFERKDWMEYCSGEQRLSLPLSYWKEYVVCKYYHSTVHYFANFYEIFKALYLNLETGKILWRGRSCLSLSKLRASMTSVMNNSDVHSVGMFGDFFHFVILIRLCSWYWPGLLNWHCVH